MNFKILENTPHITTEYLAYLTQAGHQLIWFEQEYDNNLIDWIIIRSQIKADKALIDRYPHLKYICRIWVGLDGVDMDYAKSKWIQVLNTPWANSNAVADLVLWGMLTLSRNVEHIDTDWQNRYNYEWEELDSLTVWIIWFGNIWRRVHQRLCGFGVKNFKIYDPFLDIATVESHAWCHLVTTVQEVLEQCDMVTLHLPLIETTKNLINTQLLEKAPTHIKIINTSRWWIINESDLYNFLQTHPEAAAMVDVWEWEPAMTDQVRLLQTLPNFVLTPHIGAMTKQATKMMHYFRELI